jgi:enoyl-CoA hydratase
MIELPSSSPHIQAFHNGTTGILMLSRPDRKNALNSEMWQAIPGCMAALADQKDLRAIVIRGRTAEAFAAGADISEFASVRGNAKAAATYESRSGAALQSIRACPLPTIALIQGFCIGGGLAIALACDLRFTSPDGVFALPPARLGLAYPLEGLKDLLSAVSPATAKELIFTARRLSAEQALAYGLVNGVAEDVEAHVSQVTETIAVNAPLTIRASKAAIDHLSARPGAQDAETVAELSSACFDSRDFAEGQAAFLEKRAPRFNGT